MKRVFDILASLVGLLILFPFLIILCIIIKINSKGKIFYMQSRVGLNNVDFKLFKFRTMHVDAEKKGLITIGSRDPRVTSIGYYLRKYKLDELPQLLNVFLGDMSLVGPRPEVRKYVDMYSVEQLKVLSVKPGITDFASIEFSNENELLGKSDNPDKLYVDEIMPHKLSLNLKYIQQQSLLLDFKLIFKTFLKIIS